MNRQVFSFVVSVLCVTPGFAFAQTSATSESAAIAQRNRGLEMMRTSQPETAIEAFQQSLSIVESPNTRLDLGRAYVAVNRFASALRELERARDTARGRIDAGEAQYARTNQAAAAEADAIRSRVPTLAVRFSQQPPPGTEVIIGASHLPASAIIAPVPVDPGSVQIRCSGPSVRAQSFDRTIAESEHATVDIPIEPLGFVRVAVRPLVRGMEVSIDGARIAPASVGAEQPLAPGSHAVEVHAPGYHTLSASRVITAGEHAVFAATLASDDNAAETATVRWADRNDSTSDADANNTDNVHRSRIATGSGDGIRTAGEVIAVLGVLVGGAGVGAWVFSDQEFHALQNMCEPGPCQTDALRSRGQTAQLAEQIGIGAMVGGGVIAVAGIILIVRGITASHSRLAVTPLVSPEFTGVLVRF